MPATEKNGRVSAVIFDWAGTTVDFGSRAPVAAFMEVFRRCGVEITVPEARGPMGKGKLDHIADITQVPRVADAWKQAHGRSPNDGDVRRMYEDFIPVQSETLARHGDIVPGALETVAWLRARGIGIGSTTGYTRSLMDVLAPIAKKSNFAPDNIICIDDVAAGRPAPWMLLRSAELLNAFPVKQVVAVDDTIVGIEAARNCGAVAIGVALTGNALGLSHDEFTQLSGSQRETKAAAARASLQAARPDFVLDSVADLPRIMPEIERLIASR